MDEKAFRKKKRPKKPETYVAMRHVAKQLEKGISRSLVRALATNTRLQTIAASVKIRPTLPCPFELPLESDVAEGEGSDWCWRAESNATWTETSDNAKDEALADAKKKATTDLNEQRDSVVCPNDCPKQPLEEPTFEIVERPSSTFEGGITWVGWDATAKVIARGSVKCGES